MVGLGSSDYGDDGFGSQLARELMEAGLPDVMVAGTAPERFLGRLIDKGFDHVVFLDATEFGAEAGSLVFLEAGEMAARFPQISTHKISLATLAAWIESSGNTRAWLLGVQPESIQQGGGLSAAVRRTMGMVKELLLDTAAVQEPVRAGVQAETELRI